LNLLKNLFIIFFQKISRRSETANPSAAIGAGTSAGAGLGLVDRGFSLGKVGLLLGGMEEVTAASVPF
jgi:hypothetical protein